VLSYFTFSSAKKKKKKRYAKLGFAGGTIEKGEVKRGGYTS
jgi:hypothetical protein